MDDKEQTPFRIGGIYRMAPGAIATIVLLDKTSPYNGRDAEDGHAFCVSFNRGRCYTLVRLSDGKNIHGSGDLIPGELNEKGEPLPTFTATLDRPAPTPKVKAALDLLEQGFKAQNEQSVRPQRGAEKLMAWLGLHRPSMLKAVRGFAGHEAFRQYMFEQTGVGYVIRASHDEMCYRYLNALIVISQKTAKVNPNAANTAEPKRPRLTWADSKPFDAFEGYQSRTINPNWAAPDSGKFADRRRDSPQVNPGHALAAVRQLVR